MAEIESGLITSGAAARQHQLSPSVIKRWVDQSREGTLQAGPSIREKALERENRELKETLAELYLQIEHLKKMEDDARRRKSATTSVTTSQNLAQFRRR